MNSYYTTKHWIKFFRWRARRASTALRWGIKNLQNAPIVFGNAMPKSGSHLISQVLQGLPNLGPFVNPGFPPVNRNEYNIKLPEQEILVKIKRMRPGDIAYGYVHAREPFISALTEAGRANLFIYRDPRDMIISHIFYATEIYSGHWMHKYYTENLNTMEERIYAAIVGVDVPGSELTPIYERYTKYLGWLECGNVLSLRFEDLILNREVTLSLILDYLRDRGLALTISHQEAIEILNQAIEPKKSGTFRKGKPGNWREHFTEANKAVFKRKTGDLLIRLGYERDNDW